MPISGQHLYCSVHTTEAIAAPGLVWTIGAGADSGDTYTIGARVAPGPVYTTKVCAAQ
jgi:hypothetical protein